MKAVLERLSRQNAALSEKVEELERRGRSSEVSKEEQVLDATQKNIEISNILEERLECLKTVVTKLELKALRAVQESTLRCSTSRTDLEEGTDAEIDKLSESLEEVRMSFIEFKQEYQDTMRYLKTDVQHLIMELDNDLMSRWRKQEEALEAMRKQMESERQQFNLDLSAKDEMLAKMAKQIDELRGQFNKSILMSNDTDEKYKPPKRVSLPSGTPPVVPSPRTAALADSMSGGGPPMPRARSSNLQGSSSSPLVPYSSPRYSRDSSDGERNSANSPLSFGNLNLRSPKKFS